MRRLILLFISGVVASQAATPEVFKANARRFYEEVWFGHKADVVDELFAEEYINHDPRDPDAKARAEGRKAPRSTQKELVRQQAASSGRIESQVAEGDLVVTRWIWSMPLASAWERFVAGKDHIEIPVVQTFRFNEAGRIVEVWNQCDDYGIDEQMRVSGLYYFEGFLFGVVLTLVASSLLRRKKPWPSAASQSKTTS